MLEWIFRKKPQENSHNYSGTVIINNGKLSVEFKPSIHETIIYEGVLKSREIYSLPYRFIAEQQKIKEQRKVGDVIEVSPRTIQEGIRRAYDEVRLRTARKRKVVPKKVEQKAEYDPTDVLELPKEDDDDSVDLSPAEMDKIVKSGLPNLAELETRKDKTNINKKLKRN